MHRIKKFIISAFVLCLLSISLLGAVTQYQVHKVRKGDTLYDLAKRYGVTVNEIKKLNNLSGSSLSLGQQLKIKPLKTQQPPPKKKDNKPVKTQPQITDDNLTSPDESGENDTGQNFKIHIVKKGDSLYEISKQYGVTVNQIKNLNNLKSSRLSVGQQLKITAVKTKTSQKKDKPNPDKQEKPSAPPPKPLAETKLIQADTTATAASTTPEGTLLKVDPELLPGDYIHVVKAKENLYRIALAAGITLKDLLVYNGFADEHVLIKAGQKLIIKDPSAYASTTPSPASQNPETTLTPANNEPSTPSDSVLIEKVYIVQRKDTLFKIAKEYNMTVEELKRLNNLTNNALKVGQKLYITAPKGKPKPKPVVPFITEEDLKGKTKIRTDLIMPDDGKVISEYGIRNGRPHKGIDLGAPTGSPVYAVLDGTVVFSGPQGNYGNVIVVEHPDYVMTVYAHNEKNLVNVGDTVKQGQIIATVGSTGNATAPHCHFEYRIKGKAINPRKVLPLSK